MSKVLIIIGIFALIGGVFSFLNSGDPKEAALGATAGAFQGLGCLLHLLFYGLLALGGLWLISILIGS